MRVGYATDLDGFQASTQTRILLESGIENNNIYVEGRGAETLTSALRALRDGDVLECAHGARALGNSRVRIMFAFDEIRAAGKVMVDCLDPQGWRSDIDSAWMLDAALKRIHGEQTGIIGNAAEMARKSRHKASLKVRQNRMPER